MSKRYINREIEPKLKTAASQFPSLIVTGPRQSGKTTLLKHLFLKTHRYVSMDNPDVRLLAANEPALFFENYPPPIIIDEIQYTPGLFSYIKMLIDKDREACGQFLLTGSQSFPLMAKVGDSLAGRLAVFTLLGFSFGEQFGQDIPRDLNTLKKIIITGSFPEIVTKSKIDLELWFTGYLQTYLERDVRQLRQLGDLTDFQRFLLLMAAFNGQVLNLSSLSRDLGVAVNTVKAWISVLEASCQIISIKPFYLNKGKRIIKSPKIYFLDTGLLCYLCGIISTNQVFRGPISGQLLETVVLSEVVKSFYNRGSIPKIFCWRTSSGEEVDFVIEAGGQIIPLEVKLSARANRQMAKGLVSFSKLFGDKIERAFLVNLSQEELRLDKEITSIHLVDFIRRWPGIKDG